MRLTLKINDVEGMDDKKRHILLVDGENLREALMEHERWLMQCVVREWLMKHPSLMSEVIDDPQVRNVIFMQEQARRTEKQERKRQRIHTEQQLAEKKAELKRQRQNEQFEKSRAYRRSINFYRDILGIEE